jgi:hypothetical protein
MFPNKLINVPGVPGVRDLDELWGNKHHKSSRSGNPSGRRRSSVEFLGGVPSEWWDYQDFFK